MAAFCFITKFALPNKWLVLQCCLKKHDVAYYYGCTTLGPGFNPFGTITLKPFFFFPVDQMEVEMHTMETMQQDIPQILRAFQQTSPCNMTASLMDLFRIKRQEPPIC